MAYLPFAKNPVKFRNEFFRQRTIKITLREKLTNIVGPFELREIASVDSTTTGSSAIGMGPLRAMMQAWYFQPVTLNVSGRSYFGAFNRSFVGPDMNVAIDRDIEMLKTIRAEINTRFENSFLPIKDLYFEMIYGDPSDHADSMISSIKDEYIGLLDDININEGETEPFIKTYRFRFVGVPKGRYQLKKGVGKFQLDTKMLDLTKTAGVKADSTTTEIMPIQLTNPRWTPTIPR